MKVDDIVNEIKRREENCNKLILLAKKELSKEILVHKLSTLQELRSWIRQKEKSQDE